MAKARHQRSRSRKAITRRTITPGAKPGADLRTAINWRSPFTIAAMVVVGLAVLWAVSSVINNREGTAGSAQPIAALNTPDFHSLLVDPQDPEHLVFGSHSGIHESHDGGFTWEAGALRDTDAMQLSASPNAPATIYATGHDVFQVSRDGGQTWQPLEHNLPGTDIHGFAQDLADPQRLFAFIVGAGVYTSRDGGTTWAPLTAQPPGGSMHVALAANGGSIYAATGAGLMVSRDGGQSWDSVETQPSGQIMSLAIAASDPRTLYAGTPNGLTRSSDGGASWIDLGPDGVVALAVAVTPTDADRVFLLSDQCGIFRSDDAGATWRQ